jgi:hypothetical protein
VDGPAGCLSYLPAPFCPHAIVQLQPVAWSRMPPPASSFFSDRMVFGSIKEERDEAFLKGKGWHISIDIF